MRHRHLIDTESASKSAMGIDDIIGRGLWADWVDLQRWCLEDPTLLDKVERVCRMHIADAGAQRHHFWMNYARARRQGLA